MYYTDHDTSSWWGLQSLETDTYSGDQSKDNLYTSMGGGENACIISGISISWKTCTAYNCTV